MTIRSFLYCIIALAFMNAAASSHARANTLVIVFRSEQASIIAADSKVTTGKGENAGLSCKVHISNDLVWATAGILREANGPFNVWNIIESAITAGGSLDEIVARFEVETLAGLKEFLPRFKESNPDDYTAIVRGNYPITAVFLQKTNVRAIYFHLPDSSVPTNVEIVRHGCPGSDCPIGELQLLMGDHDAADFEIRYHQNIWNTGIIKGLNYLIEAQSLATPNYVSAPVSILRIDKGGALTWLQQGECH